MIKKIAGIFAFILTLSAVLPVTGVLVERASAIAPEQEGNYAKVVLRQSETIELDGNRVIATYSNGDGAVYVTGMGNDAVVELDENYNYGNRIGVAGILWTKSSSLHFQTQAESGVMVEHWVNGQRNEFFNGSIDWGELEVGQQYEAEFMFRREDGLEPGSEPGEGRSVFVLNGCDEIETGCHADLEEDLGETVVLRLSTLWHMRFVNSVTVNGVNYALDSVADYLDYDNQESYLNHYDHQIVGFRIEVPKAADDVYEIDVEVEESEHVGIGNFLWTADPEQKYERDEEGGVRYDEDGNPVPGRNYIGNASISLVAVEYTVAEMTYGCDANEEKCWVVPDEEHILADPEHTGIVEPWVWNEELGRVECSVADERCEIPYLEFDSRGGAEFDDGSLVVPSGARITLKVVPDYGYQVLNVNMAELEVSEDGVGEFTFTVPEKAGYFVADVVEIPDSVNVESELVSAGEIDLGEGQTSLTQGTARLDVEDLELSEEQKAEFTGAAEGYEVKNFLNISLYNVVYKGTEEEAWENQVEDLNEEATITLRLEEGVDGNEVVIVHQEHDGSYEVIPAEYDAENHTLTFRTSSFSNYAIASRTSGTPETGRMTKDGSWARESWMILGMSLTLVGVIVFRRLRER